VTALRNKDDQKIILFNRIIDHARQGGEAGIRSVCRQLGVDTPVSGSRAENNCVVSAEDESREFTGAAVARGYRTFLLQPGGRGTHRFFTGEAQSRPYRVNGVTRYRNVRAVLHAH